ncbi:relaxase domain-containing protein [Leucobacter allii]|uniref:Relaxase domain-containing protein n=1 Tax=Leucobacter allii TaxID=2932247 RepID=A0ABY4FI73_9MICO|nr:MobF family relaxase [Leucobacter allii]UOQ56364.1 relaxase domain-containing protein [Leucobacter allii]
MTISIRVMTAGQGYRYLLNSVVVGDGDRDAATALTRYYEQSGTPPGRWHGSGLAGLEQPVAPGSQVSEEQLRRLLGHGHDPVTDTPLGRPFRTFVPEKERVQARVDQLPNSLTGDERAAETARIEAEEAAKPVAAPVAGFDLTFSVPKSVSTLWAVSDAGTQALIAEAHHAAMNDVIDLIERDVAMTRVGAAGPRGAVAQVEIRGLLATAYDHYDSRSSDPQLHTHLVVANRVQAVRDGKWRTLDSRALHNAVTGLSEHYNAVLSDHLARALEAKWEARERGPGRSTAWEIADVPQELMDEFSSRTRDIEDAKNRLVDEYVAKHGRKPSSKVLWQIRQQATLETRPEKEHHSLADLTTRWRERAEATLDADPLAWAREMLAGAESEPLLRADDLPSDTITELADIVVATVADRRSTWRRWNLHAEAVRQSMPWRFASAEDRDAIVGMITDAAEQASLALTPPELASTPERFLRSDGSSAFRPRHATVYSSTDLLAAEDRLLAASRDRDAPTVTLQALEHAARTPASRGEPVLSIDQEQAISQIGVSGRVLDVLVGPAGSGKTSTMKALRRAWETEHGLGSVVGLAPSAVAAAVLGEDLGIQTENTAKWLFEHRRGAWDLQAGQLLIVDEASLAGTLALDQLTAHARQVGAKILLVGDPHQLSAVDAGGAFGLIVRDRPDVARLAELHRFRHAWEKRTSLALRLGDAEAIDEYINRDRVHDGDYDDILEEAYQAWRADQQAGKASQLIAETIDTVSALNARARLDRIATGEVVDEPGVTLHDGNHASRGDVVVTRRNERRLALGRGWVKNGDRWIVTGTREDGSVAVRRENSRWRTTITLPASYVADELELAYAVTAHRAQGSTVDTAHAIVHSPEMTRESLYVSMTRGREANHVYVATDQAHLEQHQFRDDLEMSGRSVLYGIVQHTGVEVSAHEMIEQEHEDASSIAQLAAEYETIAVEAQANRWLTVLTHAGLTGEQLTEVADADSFGVLSAELRRLEASGHRVEQLLTAVVRAGRLENVEDIGSLLRHRVTRLADRYQPSPPPRPGLIAGLIPRAQGAMNQDDQAGLSEREALIEQRAQAALDRARDQHEPWLTGLPEPESVQQQASLRVIAAYRDRWRITGTDPLGPDPDNDAQCLDYRRASAHLEILCTATDDPTGHTPAAPNTGRDAPQR